MICYVMLRVRRTTTVWSQANWHTDTWELGVGRRVDRVAAVWPCRRLVSQRIANLRLWEYVRLTQTRMRIKESSGTYTESILSAYTKSLDSWTSKTSLLMHLKCHWIYYLSYKEYKNYLRPRCERHSDTVLSNFHIPTLKVPLWNFSFCIWL